VQKVYSVVHVDVHITKTLSFGILTSREAMNFKFNFCLMHSMEISNSKVV